MTQRGFAAFLKRNGQFRARGAEILARLAPFPEPRYDLASRSALLSAEHAAAAFVRISHRFYAPGCTPQTLLDQLQACKDAMWKALNSYNHGGFHPLARFQTGYPPQLCYDVLRNSNAMMALVSQLAAIVTGNHQNMAPARALHTDFADCLPILSN